VQANVYLEVVMMDQFQEVAAYEDGLGCLKLRKRVMLMCTYVSRSCDIFIKNTFVEGI
jgi:hypothetical protein